LNTASWRPFPLSLKQKLYAFAVIQLGTLLLLGLLASRMVSKVHSHAYVLANEHAILLEISDLAAKVNYIAGLERHLNLGDPAEIEHYLAANRAMATGIASLQQRFPAESRRQESLHKMHALIEAQRADLVQVSRSRHLVSRTGPPQLPMPLWLPETANLKDLLRPLWQAQTAELQRSRAAEGTVIQQVRTWTISLSIAGCLPTVLLLFFIRRDLAWYEEAASHVAKIKKELAAAGRMLLDLSAHLEAAREDERAHIARELRNHLGSTLTALKRDLLSSAGKEASSLRGGPGIGLASLTLVDSALQTVKGVVTDLRAYVLDKFGLWEALKWKAEQLEQTRGIVCRIYIAEHIPLPPKHISIGVYRAVEEILTIVARHTETTRVDIAVSRRIGGLEIAIAADGGHLTYVQVLSGNSIEFLALRVRAKVWGGEFLLESNRAGGNTVRLCIPAASIDG
jgi:signal transduction histidine kinase